MHKKNVIITPVSSLIERIRTLVYTQKRSFHRKAEKKSFWSRGFTLGELLIVIAIIGMLAAGIVTQLASSRARARDATREKSVKTLQDAFELYYTNQRLFPITASPVTLTGADAISLLLESRDAIHSMPRDPLNSGNYIYVYNSPDGTTYTITYYLETNTIPGKAAGVQTASP